jgi:hypothetical protein
MPQLVIGDISIKNGDIANRFHFLFNSLCRHQMTRKKYEDNAIKERHDGD